MRSAQVSFRTASIAALIGYLFMLASPIAEFLIYHKLVVTGNPAETVKNISGDLKFFNWGIFAYVVNYFGDIIAAWGLYFLLKPVNAPLSLLTAWIRLVYTVISLAAVLNLTTVSELLQNPDFSKAFDPQKLQALTTLYLHAFRNGWSFSFIFFGIHLILLGYLVFKSNYIPKLIGVVLIVAGVGWLAENLQTYLYPNFNVNIGMLTGFGELIFMFWLLFRGIRIKETTV